MTEPTIVAALYKFVAIEKPHLIRDPLRQCMLDNDVRGTLLLAQEGINGTVAGSRAGIDALLGWLRANEHFTDIDVKESETNEPPFSRTKVKLKREIVTMGVDGIDPRRIVGTYVKPADWNALIDDPDTLVIDTRNDYEVAIGRFRDAVDPNTKTFREFPDYARENLDPGKHKRVAMYCTGGIRCEKSTAWMLEQGFEEVYHLEGGILKYLEEVPEKDTRWEGECFVFDERVTVDHNLERGAYQQCHACRRPISDDDMASPKYVRGVSCPYCYDTTSESQRASFAERERQVQLAERRGQVHLGGDVAAQTESIKAQRAERDSSDQ